MCTWDPSLTVFLCSRLFSTCFIKHSAHSLGVSSSLVVNLFWKVVCRLFCTSGDLRNLNDGCHLRNLQDFLHSGCLEHRFLHFRIVRACVRGTEPVSSAQLGSQLFLQWAPSIFRAFFALLAAAWKLGFSSTRSRTCGTSPAFCTVWTGGNLAVRRIWHIKEIVIAS